MRDPMLHTKTRTIKSEFKKELDLLWTDGGNPGGEGYFDGSGDLNYLLKQMFAGNEHGGKLPVQVDVMDSVTYGARIKLIIQLEIEEDV